MAGLRIKVCVAPAGVDGAMTDAEIGQVARTVEADRDVARGVGHPIVNAVVPAHDGLRIQISGTGHCVTNAASPRGGKPVYTRRNRPVQFGAVAADEAHHADEQLTAKYWRRERIARIDEYQINILRSNSH